MNPVFLSYSTKDFFFAELAEVKLYKAGIKIWRDKNDLIAGNDWRRSIEVGIANAEVVLVALSSNSAASSYVTYEWAYAIGYGKTVIPLKLDECKVHPRLETIQFLDFSNAYAQPWDQLIERIKENEADKDQVTLLPQQEISKIVSPDDALVKSVLGYLNKRGYQMASFDRLRRRIDEKLSDEQLSDMVKNNGDIFRIANLKDGKKGLAKLIP